jgi:type I restriction enzyme S subunit
VRIPSIAQQIRITDILDRADAIRRKRKQAIALTEQLLRSTFLEMFGDPVTNPKAWPMATVGELTSAIKDGPHVSPRYAATGVPFISTRNIRPGKLLLNDVKYLTEADYADVTKQFRPQAGDVLLTKGGTTGFAKVVDWDWPFAVWVHLAVLRPQPNVLPEYLEAALNSPNCYAQAQHYTRGIANRDLGLSRIAKIRMAIPPIELQRTYRSCQQQLNAVIAKQEVGLQDVEALVAALVSAAFTHGTV